jgi:hypothetical protein
MGESPKLRQCAQRDLAQLELTEVRLASVDRTAHTQPARQIHGISRDAARAEGSLAQGHGAGWRKSMFGHQGSSGVAEGHPCMHRMSRQQTAGQCPLTARIEQPCQLFEIDRDAFLITVGAGRTDG